MLNKTHRLLLGIVVLILVDIIWVSSSELTKVFKIQFIFIFPNKNFKFNLFQYLYQNEKYDKPFFCTYFKTSMFTLYLLGLGLIAPWKEACTKKDNYTVKIKKNIHSFKIIKFYNFPNSWWNQIPKKIISMKMKAII